MSFRCLSCLVIPVLMFWVVLRKNKGLIIGVPLMSLITEVFITLLLTIFISELKDQIVIDTVFLIAPLQLLISTFMVYFYLMVAKNHSVNYKIGLSLSTISICVILLLDINIVTLYLFLIVFYITTLTSCKFGILRQ